MSTDDPKDDDLSARPRPLDEVELAIEKVAEEFLSHLRQGGSDDYTELVGKHPELAPNLEARLKIYLAIYRATKDSRQLDETTDALATVSFKTGFQDVAFHIRCPHCGNKVQVVGKGEQELTCQSCGSSVKVKSSSHRRGSAAIMPLQLEHFRLIRPLGEGGFGVVYLAEDQKLDKLVAIKVPRRGFFTSADEENRFFREARNASRLQHPNIAQVHQICETEEYPFIVIDFIDGWTLRDLNRDGSLDYKQKVELLIQVAEAVHFAHSKHVIHRDLKSSNILVDHNHRAFVVDFGLSRRDDVELTMTMEGAAIGTAQYMSPEQAAGHHSEVGPLSDVYSLGVILYELLCNELPFQGSKYMIMEQVIHDEPRYPHRLKEGIPRDLETITLKAMSKDRAKRYASAQDFAEDLRRWCRREPILARPLGIFGHFLNWSRRHPAVAALGSIIVTLLLLTTGISIAWSYEQARLNRLERTARTESESRRHQLLVQNGTFALRQNDLTVAARWFAEALPIKDDVNSRLRLGLIQDRLPKLNHLWSIGSSVNDVVFNRDGSRMAVASWAGRVQVFDVATRKSLFDQRLPAYQQLAFSPTGSHVLSCGEGNTAQLWNIDQNQLIGQLQHADTVISSSFHASSPLVATGSWDSYVRLWNLSDGSRHAERKFEGMSVGRVEFVPEQNLIIVVTKALGEPASPAGEQVQLWDYVQDRVVSMGPRFSDHIFAIELANQGKHLCVAARDGEVRVLNMADGSGVGEPLKLPLAPRHVFFGGSAEQLVSITFDSQIEVWNIPQAKREKPRAHGTVSYASAQMDAAGKLVALGGNDGSVSILWRDSLLPATSLLHNGESATAVAFHPDGRRLAVGGSQGLLQLWDLAGAAPDALVFEHTTSVRNALLSPDGRLAYTICNDGLAMIWDTVTGQALDCKLQHASSISDCALSPDGKIFATSSLDKRVKLWDAHTGLQIGGDLEHSAQVMTLAISPKGDKLAAACSDGSLSCWNLAAVQTDKPSPLFTVRQDPRILAVCFNSQGSLIAAASLSGDVRCWDAVSGSGKLGSFLHRPKARDCLFARDNDQDQLLTAGVDEAWVWKTANKEVVQRLPCAGEVISLCISSSGNLLSTNENEGRCRLWQRMQGKYHALYELRDEAIQSIYYSQFDRNGSILAFGGGGAARGVNMPLSGAVVLWDMVERLPLGPPLIHEDIVRRLRIDADGRRILTASEDGTARLWKLVPSELPTGDVLRLAHVYAQASYDDSGRVNYMHPERQLKEFSYLSENYPNLFLCDASEIESWNGELRRAHSDRADAAPQE